MQKGKQIIIYREKGGCVRVEVNLSEETLWLAQKLTAELFGVSIPTVNEHLKNIFFTRELEQKSVIRKFLITADDGKKYNTKHYNLDVIIALGYRVNSKCATQFRMWATRVSKPFFVL